MPIWIMYCEGISLPKKKRYFHEVIEEDEKILAIGLKQSKQNKEERREKTLHEVLMEGFREEQKQRELEELEEEND